MVDRLRVGLRIGVEADQAVREVGRVDRSLDGLRSTLGGLATAAAGAFAIGELGRVADEFSQIQSRLRVAVGSTREATAAYSDLLAVSQETRTALGGTVDLFASLSRGAAALQLTQDQVVAFTRTVNQTIALSGVSAQASEAALVQFSQALASGVLRGEELNSILEQTPALADAIARGLGVTVGELRALGEAGALSAKAITEALRNQAPEIEREFAKLTPTISQSLTQLQNAFLTSLGQLDQSFGASSGLARAISGLSESIDALQLVIGAGLSVAIGRAAGALPGLIAALGRAALAMTSAAATAQGYNALLVSNAAAQGAAAAAANVASRALGLLGGPIGAVVTVLGLAATAWAVFGQNSESALESASQRADSLAERLRRLNADIRSTSGAQYNKQLESARREREFLSQRINTLNDRASNESGDDFRKTRDELQPLIQQFNEVNRLIQNAERDSALVNSRAVDAYVQDESRLSRRQAQLKALNEEAKRYVETFASIDDATPDAETKRARALGAYRQAVSNIQDRFRERQAPAADLNAGQDVAAAQAYARAIQELIRVQDGAQVSAESLSRSQQILRDLVSSPEWSRLPQPWREVIQAYAESAEAAEQSAQSLSDYQSRIANLAEESESLLSAARAAEAEAEQAGLTEAQLRALQRAREDEAIALRVAEAERLRAIPGREAEAYLIEQQVTALQRVRDANLRSYQTQKGTYGDLGQLVQDFAQNVRTNLGERVSAIITGLSNRTVSLNGAFRDLASSLAASFIEMANQRFVIQPLLDALDALILKTKEAQATGGAGSAGVGSGGLFGFIGGLFDGGGGASNSRDFDFGVAHTGGIVGQLTNGRTGIGFSTAEVARAPRFHSGGVLAADERLIVGRVGEEVLTADDPRHVRNGGMNQRGFVVQVVEAPGAHVAQMERTSEGGKDVLRIMLSQIKEGLAQDLRKGSGSFVAAMEGTYGLSRAAGLRGK